MNKYTNNQERRSGEEKLTARSTLWHIWVTGKRSPGKKLLASKKWTDVIPLLYEYVVTSILCRKTTVLWIEHRPVLIGTAF